MALGQHLAVISQLAAEAVEARRRCELVTEVEVGADGDLALLVPLFVCSSLVRS